MTRMKTLHKRRKRRSQKSRRGTPNRGSKHKGRTGRTGGMHHKKMTSRKHVVFTVSIPRSLAHLFHFKVEKHP